MRDNPSRYARTQKIRGKNYLIDVLTNLTPIYSEVMIWHNADKGKSSGHTRGKEDDIYKQDDILRKLSGATHGNCEYGSRNSTWEIDHVDRQYYTLDFNRENKHIPIRTYTFRCSKCNIYSQEIHTTRK